MSLRNAKEYRSMTAQCHKIYLSGPFAIFCLYVILTISYLRAQTIEMSSLPILPIPCGPCSSILTVSFNCKYFPYYTCELLECLLRISPSCEIPVGAINARYFGNIVLCEGGEAMVLLVFYKYGFFVEFGDLLLIN